MKKIILISFLFLFVSITHAQRIYWNTYGGACTDVFNAITPHPTVTASQWVRGATTCTSNTTGFSTTGFTSTDLVSADAANHYIEATLTETGGLSFDLDSFVWISYRSGTGPNSVDVQYSINGAPFVNFGAVTGFVTGTTYTFTIVSPITIPAFGNVRIRMYAWGASSALGTMRLVQGSYVHVSNCDEPILNNLPTDVSCNGVNDGAVDLTLTDGTAPFIYAWDGPGGFTASTEDISGLAGGTYTVTVTATGGCTTSTTAIVNEPTAIDILSSPMHVSCFGDSDGEIDITPSGGAGGYTFLWSDGSVTEDIFGLVTDTYTVTVTDADGCTNTASVTINEPADIILNSSVTHVTCNGLNNGSIDLSPSGGVGSFTYDWSNGAISQDVFLLTAGSYEVIVTGGDGCEDSTTIIVNENSAITVGLVPTYPSCSSVSNGSIDCSPFGGTGSYTFLWNTGATTEDIGGLANGIYSVTVTDGIGCTSTAVMGLTSGTNLILDFSWVNAGCSGASNGSIDLTPVTGAAPFNYIWSNSATTEGTYTVTVTDAGGCNGTGTAFVGEPGQIVSNIEVETCGSYVSPSGNYTWFVSGLYADTITAANGCDSLIGIDLYIITPNTVVMNTGATLMATFPGAAYQWLNCDNNMMPVLGATGQFFTPGSAGSFAVIVNNAGCFDTSECHQTINVGLMQNDLDVVTILYPNPNNGIFNLAVNGLLSEDLYIEILDVSGKMLYQQLYMNEVGTSVNIPFDQSHLENGVYFVRVFSAGRYKVLKLIKNL